MPRNPRRRVAVIEGQWSPGSHDAPTLCHTPDKDSYDTRGEAKMHVEGNVRHVYECACGKFHLTRHRRG